MINQCEMTKPDDLCVHHTIHMPVSLHTETSWPVTNPVRGLRVDFHIYELVGRQHTYPSMWRGQASSEPRTLQSSGPLSIVQPFGVNSRFSYVDNKYSEPCHLRAFPWIRGIFFFVCFSPSAYPRTSSADFHLTWRSGRFVSVF